MNSTELEIQRSLSDRDMVILNAELEREKKNVLTAYVLLIFLWGVGAHQFYLGRAFRGLMYPLLTIIGWFLLTGSAVTLSESAEVAGTTGATGLLCLAVVGIMLLVDLVSLPSQCNSLYRNAKRRLLLKLERDRF